MVAGRARSCGLLLTAAGLLAGCSSDGLVEVKGTATFDGKPIPAGVVWFNPDGAGGQGFAFVKDGKFSTADKGGRGIKPGPYVVRVEGFDGRPTEAHPSGLPLFPEYQEKKQFAGPEELALTVPDKKAKK